MSADLLRLAALAKRVGLSVHRGVLWDSMTREHRHDGWFCEGNWYTGTAWALFNGRERVLFGGPWEPRPWAYTYLCPERPFDALARAERELEGTIWILSGGATVKSRVLPPPPPVLPLSEHP